jgi:hypothetical protein
VSENVLSVTGHGLAVRICRDTDEEYLRPANLFAADGSKKTSRTGTIPTLPPIRQVVDHFVGPGAIAVAFVPG